jgi:hypothetical protein
MDAVQEFDNPALQAIIFRRSFPELLQLIRRSKELYAALCPNGIKAYNKTEHLWTFPSGATIRFAYLEQDDDVYRYQGSEFTYISFDEATHWQEFPIRYMLSRLRSTSRTIKKRMRLGTNPGNIGHLFLKKIFLGERCPHCQPPDRIPFQIYADAVWPSDGKPIGKTTCFIPARLTDHNLLGEDYVANLETQSGRLAQQLLEGCWEVTEGQYFDIWNKLTMVQKRRDIPVEPWWPHWVGSDYGFSISIAAAYQMCWRPPYQEKLEDGTVKDWRNGRMYFLDEVGVPKTLAGDFSRLILRRWILDEAGNKLSTNYCAFYLSPDASAKTGLRGSEDLHSRKAQMDEELVKYGFAWQNASNDRAGGAIYLYNGLKNGEIVVCDSCPQLIEALQTRLIDPDKADDVLKVSGDPLDDYYDGARYAAYSHRFNAKKPIEQRVMEVTRNMDPLNAFLTRERMKSDFERESKPIITGGTALRRGVGLGKFGRR